MLPPQDDNTKTKSYSLGGKNSTEEWSETVDTLSAPKEDQNHFDPVLDPARRMVQLNPPSSTVGALWGTESPSVALVGDAYGLTPADPSRALTGLPEAFLNAQFVV